MLDIMTKKDFDLLMQSQMADYYKDRWAYFKEVIAIIKIIKPENALELGPAKHTIIKNCDIMVHQKDDSWGKPVNKVNKIFYHNATIKPWPVNDKSYDVFIALQVWEHLDNKQARAFREVMRISRSAILSFPFNWNCPEDNPNYPEHHMIDKELIGDWTLNIEPKKIIQVERTGTKVSKGPRLIYYWEFS